MIMFAQGFLVAAFINHSLGNTGNEEEEEEGSRGESRAQVGVTL